MAPDFNKKPFEGLNAMVVDDVGAMRELLTELLREIGFETIINAEDGGEALKTLEDMVLPIDVIICDLEMPLISGLEFIRMLRKNRNLDIKDLPIVVVTGHSEKKNLYTAVDLGVHGFLVKPVSLAALEKSIERALKKGPIDPEAFEKAQPRFIKPVHIIEG